jgi:hypothetical protein
MRVVFRTLKENHAVGIAHGNEPLANYMKYQV